MPPTASQIQSLVQYDGSTDIEVWITQVEEAATLYEWAAEDTAAAAKRRMTGEGATFLLRETKKRTVLTTWAQLLPALRARFGETVTELAAANSILHLRQKENESVDAFYDRVVIAMDKKNHLYTEAQKATNDYLAHFNSDIFTFFASGLKDTLRSRTLGTATPPRTADALLTAAKIVEADMKRDTQRKTAFSVETHSQGEAQQPPQLNEPEDLETAIHMISELNLALFNSGQKSNITCYRCGGRGHTSNVCGTPSGSGQRAPTNKGSYNKGFNNRNRNNNNNFRRNGNRSGGGRQGGGDRQGRDGRQGSDNRDGQGRFQPTSYRAGGFGGTGGGGGFASNNFRPNQGRGFARPAIGNNRPQQGFQRSPIWAVDDVSQDNPEEYQEDNGQEGQEEYFQASEN